MLVKKKKNDEDILNTLNSFTSGLNDTNIKSLEERTSPTTKTYNANELKNLLNNAESSRKNAVSNFNKYLGNNNVISNSQNPLLTPTAKELRDSKDLIKSPINTRNALTDELQNQQNYRNAIKTDEAKSLLNDVNEKKVASGLLRGKYNLEAAKEDVANDSNFDILLKTISSPLRGIATMFGHDGALTYNEKGEIVKGKSILQAQSDEMAKLGGATGFVNQMGDQLGKQSVQMLLNSLIPGTGNAAYFSTLANDVYDETKREGYNDKQAYLYTALNTASEYFVGKALGSTIGKYSKSNETEKTISNILKPLIKNAEVNKTLSTMTAEGLEEFVQEYVDVVARNVSLGEDNKVDFDTFKNALYSFGLGAASSGVMSSVDTALKTKNQKNTEQEAYDVSRKMNKNFDESTNARIIDAINHQKEKGNYSQENLINQLSKENQVIDELVKNKIGDKKVNKKEESKIREEIVNNLEKGYTDLDDIVNILGGKDLKDFNDYNDLLNKYNEINGKTKKSSLDNEELSRLYENMSKYDFDKLKTNLLDKINIDEDSLLYNSVRENDNKKIAYKNDLNLYDKNQQKVIKNAIDSGILNNSRKTHDFVDMIAKISSDKNVTFDFTNNKKLQESGFALKDKQVNGFINNDKITINIESKNALNSVVGHEVTHVLEGSKLYAELQQAVKEYATIKGDYESRLAETTELYKNIKGANIENELTSVLVGEYIFTDTDFVSSLSTTKPNVFQKIYNEIKYLYKLATAGSKEARQLEKVKKTFENAYKESNYASKEIKYSIAGVNGMKNANNKALENLYNEALKLDEEGVSTNEIRQKTRWYKDKNGDWKFEVSDNDFSLKKTLKKNGNYKLGDIINHDTIFMLYPELKNINVSFENMNHSGGFNNSNNTIRINNSKFDSENNYELIKRTLIHEMQHAIQHIEGYSTGTTSKFNKQNYVNNLGEIEAADTARRMVMDYNQRMKIAPESSKANPMHPNQEFILNSRGIVEKMRDGLYNFFKGENNKNESDSKNKSSFSEDYVGYDDDRVGSGITRGSKQELDNSSFSLNKNAKQYDELTKTNYIDYFRKDNGDVKVYLMDSNNNLVNELSLWSNTNATNEFGENLGNKIYETATDSSQRIEIGNDINNLGAETDYFMNHRPSEGYGNASNFEENMPDVFEHPEWYLNLDEKYNRESLNALKKVRNNPDAELTIYRATIGNKINPGDWVTPSKAYAEYHNNSQFDGKGNVLEMKVKAKDIQFAGDDINEFGYFPNTSYSLANQNKISPKNSNLTYSDDVKINTDNKSLKNEIENADKSVKKINIKDIKNLSNVKNKEEKNLSPVKGEQSAKILSKTPIDTSKGSIKSGINIFRAAILDKGSVFEDLAIKSKNRQLMATWDSTMTSQAKAQNIIGDGYQKFNSETKSIEKLSKSLYEIQNEVVNSGNIEDFSNYIYHKHNIDRMNLKSKAETELSTFENNNHDLMFKNKNSQRSYDEILELSKLKKATNEKEENLISAAKEYVKLKEKYDKTDNKPVFGNDVTAEISQELVNEYENAHPEFIDYASDIYDYLKAQKQTLVDNGIISQETSDLWNEMYPHYVPISRVNENNLKIDVPLKRTGTNNPVKAATGGNSDILPLFDTLADRTFQTQKAIDKNKFGIELMNSLDTTTEFDSVDVDGLINDIDNQENLLNKGTKEKLPTFTVFKNGERITYAINQDMYEALSPISNIPLLNVNSKTLNKLSSFQRGVLTEYNPVFMITNAVKDAQDVLINSQHAAKTYSKFLEAQKQIKNKGYYYQEYMANGGEQNTYFDYKTKVFDTKEDSKLKKIFKMPLEKISEANDFIEMTPRLAEYIASRESGRSVEVSMLDAARVTTNFKAGGDATKWLNRNGWTFLNASVQGFNQQVRNFREANANGIRGYAGLALKFAVASLPVIALNNLVWKDDDDYEEELSDYVKQNYYVVFRYGKGKYIRIPKGRTLSVIQNFVEQTENAVKKTGEFDVNEFINMAIDNLAPNNPLENNVISPLVQAASNKTWYKTDLVPTRLQNKPAAEQYDESIDEISKWLGKTFNVSPYKINYIMNQYSGGVGDVIMPMLTPETKSGNNTLLEYALSPLVDKFTADSVMNNKNTGNLYETSEKLTINANKSNATNEDILKNKFVNSMKSEMNDLYKEKREIQNSNISKKEKYEKVRGIQNQINEMSKYALNNYSDVKIDGNYATIGTKEYRLKTDIDGAESWTKITDDQKNKQRNVSSALGITASEYWSNKTEYDYAYDNPGKYATITSITDYDTYTTYSKEISNIKSDKDSKGNSITDSRKKKVFAYINNLDLEFEQKLILAKMQYPSYNQYNNEILNYLNKNNDINYNEKILILKQLGFTVDEKGKVRW